MKKSRIIFLPIVACSLLAGCSKKASSSSEITLTIYEDESNVEVVKTLADQFLSEYRNEYTMANKINIEVVKQPEKSAIEKLASGVAESGKGPDIAAVTHDTIARGVTSRIVSKAMFAEDMKQRMTPDALNAVTYDGEVYGYPITAESLTIMYDKTQVSTTELASWEALKASGKKLSMQLTGDDGGYYTWGFCNDSVLFGEDGKDKNQVNIGTTKAVANMTNFFKNYKDSVIDAAPETGLNHVVSKRVVGVVTSPFLLASMKNALGNNLALAKMPTLNGEEMRPFSGYKAYVVSRYSKNAALAHAFCNYMTTAQSNAYRLAQKGYLPAVPLDASQDIRDLIATNKEASVFAESLRNSMVMPNIPETANLWAKMNNATTFFSNNSTTLTEEVVKQKLDEVTQAIKQG